ncbi:MAG TPA: ChaN family lipoprotein, partial [Desulfuromonadaceae bacterium]
MRGIYRLAMMFLALAAVIAVVRHCSTTFRPLRLSDRKIIGTEQMMKEVGAARVVYVGEVHDRMRDHAAQLRIIEGLRRRG